MRRGAFLFLPRAHPRSAAAADNRGTGTHLNRSP
ncbi:UNVERIFIED_ORG: hypothetical protein GGI61_006003 [Rhizobium esperanzae]